MLASAAGRNGGAPVHVAISRTPADVSAVIEQGNGSQEHAWAVQRSPELASLRERVRLAGGRLVAKSDRAGSTVKVQLPLRSTASVALDMVDSTEV